ncbi:MAG: lysylphosphatidylglycerol synthase transmembrane domain-containing protein [Bacteroidales bacterium]|nr:lysylphosphatidylglycerol synthase transmembrane domain-containing protein [Bacteroidales bacterium]
MRKNIINAATGIIIGGFFLYLTLRNKALDKILELLSEASTGWILLAIVFLIIMFFFRAYRWRLLLRNSGEYPDIKNVSYSLLLGFFINSFTPKLGEIIRCTSLQKSSGIKVSKSFGTVISERIYDLLILMLGIITIIVLEFRRLGGILQSAKASIINTVSENYLNLVYIILGLLLVGVVLFIIFKRFRIIEKIHLFLKDLLLTVKQTFRIKSYGIFTFQTVMIWLLMGLMNYCCLRALPSTENLSLYFAFVVLFIGTIGWAIPSPGGIGTSHFFVLQLFTLFNMSTETGIAYGLLVNGITVLFTIAAGLLTLIIVNSLRMTSQLK